ncbi:PIN domain-like protein [Stereum hirsutum FP-91666 SS1]|uniref:PIN domain-like protein n=1 Tax=Stereum hirsutum (strain FP-91666) TaxID=721885 RepID=UPI000440FCED|nr:PIN domain-like protein [Stereum hirsutum FP-91666 SS1]EIM91084.1 PIN domain-like protein [Stereum hirsutum FP-91666 SS1]
MGVKSLWDLLSPVGRPVLLETMEGKAMAIDSSIWIYQFQATMRDKEGRALVNAHLVGFLRRICKLLFYGIKPVFVFDGGAPALKRATISERKKKKSGAAASHVKIAERLLAAQMRREALNHTVGSSSKGKGKAAGPVTIDENTVFLEDIDSSLPKTPARKEEVPNTLPSSSSTKKKNRWHDHDPYRLPDVDLDARVSSATRSSAPDPRLATEEELRDFIEEMRPEDFDVSSPAFRELPTEVQYEIIGDLRLKSRQTSYKRLQNMLKKSRTALDFSKEQIKNLKQRNSLTQQLLVTTDTIGQAHVSIPIRVASERNREYVLIKNEGKEGGWVLGIREEGSSRAKPIEIDQEDVKARARENGTENMGGAVEDEDSDMDMEEVEIPQAAPMDPDLREYRRGMALASISRRSSSHTHAKLPSFRKSPSKSKNPPKKKQRIESRPRPLFEPEDDELPRVSLGAGDEDEDATFDEDPELLAAMQESMEVEEEAALRRALEASRMSIGNADSRSMDATSTTDSVELPDDLNTTVSSDVDEDLYVPGRLETALAIAGAGPTPQRLSSVSTPRRSSTLGSMIPESSMFGKPTLLLSTRNKTPTKPVNLPTMGPSRSPDLRRTSPSATVVEDAPFVLEDSDDDLYMEEVYVPAPTHMTAGLSIEPQMPDSIRRSHSPLPPPVVMDDSDEDMEEIVPSVPLPAQIPADDIVSPQVAPLTELIDSTAPSTAPSRIRFASPPLVEAGDNPSDSPLVPEHEEDLYEDTVLNAPSTPIRTMSSTQLGVSSQSGTGSTLLPPTPSASISKPAEEPDESDEALTDWSRSPSPVSHQASHLDVNANGNGNEPVPSSATHTKEDNWDAAQEMDPHAEEGEFARFISQVKGKDLDSVRREIDEEIKGLNQQRKAAMRDSEDVTQHMISQIMIMLRLFGIPYITAPMEAEAQCATLVQLGLVEGIITDDSDVFLFGGLRVFKNMFNQSKTVECFLLSDLARELGLERNKLVQLAYLLGSDYTEGLPGVGPVVAMELLKEFHGDDALSDFREWWVKVQSGRDRPEESKSKFKKRFKKRFKDLYLPDDWPNAAVKEAYYHPTVDDSEEPFKWGLPDLDGLRSLFQDELGWSSSKVEELLLPIIQKMNKRGQVQALNRQGNLNEFFDVSGGMGSAAPRKKQAYTSKRLQQVVSDFRKAQKQNAGENKESDSGSESGAQSDGGDEKDGGKKTNSKGKGKNRQKAGGSATNGDTRGGGRGRGKGRGGAAARGRGRGRGAATSTANGSTRKRKRAASASSSNDDGDDPDYEGDAGSRGAGSASGSKGAGGSEDVTTPSKPRPRPRPVRKAAEKANVSVTRTDGAEDGAGSGGAADSA